MQCRNEHPVLTVPFLGKREKTVENWLINYDITISMKTVSQHATRWKIVFAKNVVLLTINLTNRLLSMLFMMSADNCQIITEVTMM